MAGAGEIPKGTLTIGEVAKLLRVSRDTVYRLAATGQLPARKVGRVWRFSAAAIERFLDADVTAGPPRTRPKDS